METDDSREAHEAEFAGRAPDRFLVKAPSINAVRRALHRAPGGVRVVGRQDRESILCSHTMDQRSLARLWPIIVSRLQKAGLGVIPPQATPEPR